MKRLVLTFIIVSLLFGTGCGKREEKIQGKASGTQPQQQTAKETQPQQPESSAHGVAQTSGTQPQQQTAIIPQKLDHEMDILGIKIGDSLDSVRNVMKTFVKEDPAGLYEITETTANKLGTIVDTDYVVRLSMYGGTASKTHLAVSFSEPVAGNRAVYIIRKSSMSDRENVLMDKIIETVQSKWGRAPFDTLPKSSKSVGTPPGLRSYSFAWKYDTNGHLVQDKGKYGGAYGKDPVEVIRQCGYGEQGAACLKQLQYDGCLGTHGGAVIGGRDGFVLSVEQWVAAWDFALNSKKLAVEAGRAAREAEIKQRQQSAGKGDIKF